MSLKESNKTSKVSNLVYWCWKQGHKKPALSVTGYEPYKKPSRIRWWFESRWIKFKNNNKYIKAYRRGRWDRWQTDKIIAKMRLDEAS